MRKILVFTAFALLIAAGAFPQAGTLPGPIPTGVLGSGPHALINQDSCEIGYTPAATLLLPYFEIPQDNSGDTIFSITNVSNVPAIAHVTIWTDLSFPVLDFNIFLTGYDVQAVDIGGIISTGALPATNYPGAVGTVIAVAGATPLDDNGNMHFGTTAVINNGSAPGSCANPPSINAGVLSAMQSALSGGLYTIPGAAAQSCLGTVSTGANPGGFAKKPWIGYITVDVAAICSQKLPIDKTYYTQEILWDNQLMGEWIRYSTINPAFASGTNMVAIPAVPPGYSATASKPPVAPAVLRGGILTGLRWTFYSRYEQDATGVAAQNYNARVPLPALFGARWINYNSGTSDYLIWREGVTGNSAVSGCNGAAYAANNMPFVDIVRFDEDENSSVTSGGCNTSPCPVTSAVLPEASRQIVGANAGTNGVIPKNPTVGATGGWTYFNLSNPNESAAAGVPQISNGVAIGGMRPTQNWVVSQLTAPISPTVTMGVDFNATYLANGCSGAEVNTGAGGFAIGPQYDSTGLVLP
jgi:hypothetical protein